MIHVETRAPEPIVNKSKGQAIALRPLVNETVMHMIPETPLSQVHTCFRQLWLRRVVDGKSCSTGRPTFLESNHI